MSSCHKLTYKAKFEHCKLSTINFPYCITRPPCLNFAVHVPYAPSPMWSPSTVSARRGLHKPAWVQKIDNPYKRSFTGSQSFDPKTSLCRLGLAQKLQFKRFLASAFTRSHWKLVPHCISPQDRQKNFALLIMTLSKTWEILLQEN